LVSMDSIAVAAQWWTWTGDHCGSSHGFSTPKMEDAATTAGIGGLFVSSVST